MNPRLPLNTRGGMRLHRRSFGVHYDPTQTQRVIGRHVYIFRTQPGAITVWRSDLASADRGYCWTRVHHFANTNYLTWTPGGTR